MTVIYNCKKLSRDRFLPILRNNNYLVEGASDRQDQTGEIIFSHKTLKFGGKLHGMSSHVPESLIMAAQFSGLPPRSSGKGRRLRSTGHEIIFVVQ